MVAYVEVVSALTVENTTKPENTERKEFKYIVIKYTYDKDIISQVNANLNGYQGTMFMNENLLNKFDEILEFNNWL